MDRPDDFDVPSSPDEGSPDRAGGGRRVAVEERDRFEYYDALRFASRDEATDVSAETRPSCERSALWDEAADQSRSRWAEHLERWPAGEREQPDRSQDPEGSWRGDSGRFLDSAANAEVAARYERVATTEREVLTPAMREIEACDPDRHLVGFEHRLKGLDRLKDKVAEGMAFKSRNAEDALANVKDTVRFTFEYIESHYSDGVHADIDRLKSYGFDQVELRNSWASDTYKGINSRWRDPATGLLYEVQFHTRESFEAKQLAHGAYERQRSPATGDAEREEIAVFQKGVCGRVPVPPGAIDIPNYP